MAAQDRIFAWVVVQEEGTDVLSPASQVWKSSQHPDLPFDIDALKNAVKAEFALRLQHVDAADQKVYAGDKELTTLSALVVDQSVGACEENPLRITYPPRAGVKAKRPRTLHPFRKELDAEEKEEEKDSAAATDAVDREAIGSSEAKQTHAV
mmetsp:Transcript_38242/g.76545  ORF Transcript_38242/g.76545 Transcript_38242/m.76545 type:complete len:152 (+) Transcript_38242:306-761(+)